VRVAGRLVNPLTLFATVTVKIASLSAFVAGGVVYVAEVAPGMGSPFLLHWYVIGAVPIAVALNVAFVPTSTVRFCGCPPISTGPTGDRFSVGPGSTVKMAGALVRVPRLSVTVTVKVAPFVPHAVGCVV
jgi:hypothetical protein